MAPPFCAVQLINEQEDSCISLYSEYIASPLLDVLLQLRNVVPVIEGVAFRYDANRKTEPVPLVMMFSKRLSETESDEQELRLYAICIHGYDGQ